ncbi:FecCD family ABC transporter permease [Anaerosphaera multitolerans]|uniref:Probable heme-iron transport system permease protein IsdF n=1 Tax=Anaerosphaera multitolerans TaxID=2487351 RepID=A0A437S5X6_9FIRM|nr:iron ABC transporter permease [Anaerosphaera multitolerans]RVU54421.1 iron ABC transporter permease [Anaerosphaera multitolerans]
MKNNTRKKTLSFIIIILLLFILFICSLNTGSLKITPIQLIRGLFINYDSDVATVYDLRFPRIIISIFAGAALAVSGTMLQAVMKNPLIDPGIIGISSAASLASLIIALIFPNIFFLTPLFSVVGGLLAYFLIYSLAWDDGVRPIRLLLVGVALNMTFVGIAEGIKSFTGGNLTKVQSIIEGNISQKTWDDVRIIVLYIGIFLIISLFTARACNLISLEDKTARSLGVNVNKYRFFIAFIAIILSSVTTAIVGVIGFLGLLVPHIGRLIVGSDHKYLIPFSIFLGAFLLLLSDTVGRIIAHPYEIQSAVIMSVVGGPFFISLLKIGGKNYGN